MTLSFSHANKPQFGALRVDKESFVNHFRVPAGQDAWQMARGIADEFTGSNLSLTNGKSLDYFKKNFNTDIVISAREHGRYNVHLVETLPGREDPEETRENKLFLFFTDAKSSPPKDVIAQAIETAHYYYSKKLVEQRDSLQAQLTELQQGLLQLGGQALKLAGKKDGD